ncbi:MAG: response regulator [Candidatus Zixiibacteriota bacterium]
MTEFYALLIPSVVLISLVFIIFRFDYFTGDNVSGRYPFLFGTVLLVFVSVWQAVKSLTEYNDWFIESVYPFLDFSQVTFFIAGVFLLVVGLAFYADFWQTKRDEIITREQQLSILSNLQKDAREPYQIVELLEISLKEVICQLPETTGAIFLVNRKRHQLVLTTAVGLSKQETAYLEHYPLGRNVITQAIELSEPMISGTFDFIDGTGKIHNSRFNSCLILPLVSINEKIGGFVLFSEKTHFFSNTEIKYLFPVVEWLAEKIKAARLTRELSIVKKESEKQSIQQTDFNKRIVSVTSSFSTSDIIASFCQSLTGLIDSQSVHLYGLKNGTLHFYGGSETLLDLSENYKTALIDAVGRNKPLIINQEAVSDDGLSFIARSTFVYPVSSNHGKNALLFVRESSPFRIDENILKVIDVYANIANMILRQNDSQHLNITRRKGLDKILALLRFDNKIQFEEDPGLFIKHLTCILPKKTIGITFVKQSNGSFKAVKGLRALANVIERFEILPGEGIIGKVLAGKEAEFVFGKNNVAESIRIFDDRNNNTFQSIIGEQETPVLFAACPIHRTESIIAVVVLFMFNISESEKTEWQKLLTLATGLYSIRLTINRLFENQRSLKLESSKTGMFGNAVNKLNNYLSAIIGNAELASMRTDLSGEVTNHFRSIINEAEHASSHLKEFLGKYSGFQDGITVKKQKMNDINYIIESVLKNSHISENIYMVGGRPREINRNFNMNDDIEFSTESIRNLFEDAINRFSSLADEEDVITISTYTRDDFVYLDISRHHKNFPPVENISKFGEYQLSFEALKYRPVDTYLKYITDKTSFYSFDRLAADPSYLSFKFPVKKQSTYLSVLSNKPKVLAIDDQLLILDLISAMCQTSGYQVITAQTGNKGLELALNEDFDIILTDLAMPGLSGLEVARKVREKKPNLPIVLITGWGVNLDETQIKASGITKILYKPFRIEQLTDIIKSLAVTRPTI